jgi:Right handed beta helix region
MPSPRRRAAALLVLVMATVACGGGSGSTAGSSSRPPGHKSSQPSGPQSEPPPVGPTYQVANAAVIAAGPSVPNAPDGPTVNVPDSIDHSCGSDVTDAINGFLGSAGDNTTIRFASQGCYRVDGTLTLDGHHRIDIEGNGALIKATTVGDRSRRDLTVSESDDIIIRDLNVIGSNNQAGTTAGAYDPDLAFQHAFTISGAHRVLLERVTAKQLHGDFVYLGGGGNTPSTDVTIANSTFEGSGRQGISVTDANRVLIIDNHIGDVPRSMFDLEPNDDSGEARNVRITGNHTGAATNFWLADKGAGNQIGPVEIDGNTMDDSTGGLIFAFGHTGGFRGPWNVRDNQFIASDRVHDERSVGAMLFANCSDISVTGNHVLYPAGVTMPAIELRTSQNVKVAGNDFTGTSQPVMSDAATTGLSISS